MSRTESSIISGRTIEGAIGVNTQEQLLELTQPDQLKDLAIKLGKAPNQFTAIYLSSVIAMEMQASYPYGGENFWWTEYVDGDEAVCEAVLGELERTMLGASRIKRMALVASILEKTYRHENDTVFIVIDLDTAAAYADLPDVHDSLETMFLPNATYFKGRRQIRGFRGGKTAYTSCGEEEPSPRSGCLKRAFENVRRNLDLESLQNLSETSTRNGLKITRVHNHPNYVCITGKVETPLPVVGQYNDEVVSPQEYVLQVMYGNFTNEPVVALENLAEENQQQT